jgi:hypothetical protein
MDFDPVDRYTNGWDEGQVSLSGEIYTRSVSIDPWSEQPSYLEYDLGRKYKRLETQMGLSDVSVSSAVVKVEIFADNIKLLDQTVRFGESVPVVLDVTNRLRLRVQVTDIVPEGGRTTTVFGDLRIAP